MTEVVISSRFGKGTHLTVSEPIAWLLANGVEFNIGYGIGWDWDNDANLLPVFEFDSLVDPRVVTAFALRYS
jgi:hypothetical protein